MLGIFIYTDFFLDFLLVEYTFAFRYMLLKLQPISKYLVFHFIKFSHFLLIFSIRGQLITYFPISIFSGQMAGCLIGAVLKYTIIPFVSILLAFIVLVLFFFMPDTPQYLLNNKQIEVNFLNHFLFFK